MKTQYYLKYQIKSEINVIPLLDILLVLLIVFMVIPSQILMQQQNFEIHLPQQNKISNIIKNKKSLITIEIIEANTYNLTVYGKMIPHISLNTLILEITSKKLITSNFTYLIAASKDEKYNEIVKILNILNNIGITSVGLITDLIR